MYSMFYESCIFSSTTEKVEPYFCNTLYFLCLCILHIVYLLSYIHVLCFAMSQLGYEESLWSISSLTSKVRPLPLNAWQSAALLQDLVAEPICGFGTIPAPVAILKRFRLQKFKKGRLRFRLRPFCLFWLRLRHFANSSSGSFLALFWASKLNLFSILQIYKQFWLYKRFWASKLNFISILQIFQQFWLNKGYLASKLNLFSIYQQEGVLDFEVEFIFILHGPWFYNALQSWPN